MQPQQHTANQFHLKYPIHSNQKNHSHYKPYQKPYKSSQNPLNQFKQQSQKQQQQESSTNCPLIFKTIWSWLIIIAIIVFVALIGMNLNTANQIEMGTDLLAVCSLQGNWMRASKVDIYMKIAFGLVIVAGVVALGLSVFLSWQSWHFCGCVDQSVNEQEQYQNNGQNSQSQPQDIAQFEIKLKTNFQNRLSGIKTLVQTPYQTPKPNNQSNISNKINPKIIKKTSHTSPTKNHNKIHKPKPSHKLQPYNKKLQLYNRGSECECQDCTQCFDYCCGCIFCQLCCDAYKYHFYRTKTQQYLYWIAYMFKTLMLGGGMGFVIRLTLSFQELRNQSCLSQKAVGFYDDLYVVMVVGIIAFAVDLFGYVYFLVEGTLFELIEESLEHQNSKNKLYDDQSNRSLSSSTQLSSQQSDNQSDSSNHQQRKTKKKDNKKRKSLDVSKNNLNNDQTNNQIIIEKTKQQEKAYDEIFFQSRNKLLKLLADDNNTGNNKNRPFNQKQQSSSFMIRPQIKMTQSQQKLFPSSQQLKQKINKRLSSQQQLKFKQQDSMDVRKKQNKKMIMQQQQQQQQQKVQQNQQQINPNNRLKESMLNRLQNNNSQFNTNESPSKNKRQSTQLSLFDRFNNINRKKQSIPQTQPINIQLPSSLTFHKLDSKPYTIINQLQGGKDGKIMRKESSIIRQEGQYKQSKQLKGANLIDSNKFISKMRQENNDGNGGGEKDIRFSNKFQGFRKQQHSKQIQNSKQKPSSQKTGFYNSGLKKLSKFSTRV